MEDSIIIYRRQDCFYETNAFKPILNADFLDTMKHSEIIISAIEANEIKKLEPYVACGLRRQHDSNEEGSSHDRSSRA